MSQASAVEALLFAALEKPIVAERIAFLDSACAGDTELRRHVEKLLKAHANIGDFLTTPVGEPLAAVLEASDAAQALDDLTDRSGGNLARTEREGESNDEDSTLDFLQPSTRPDALGRIGHYDVLEVLGKGGFGIVFRAIDETLLRVVAIKVLRAQIAATSPARKRFLREARSSAKVRHENVVQVYAVEEQPLPYLVMEFIPGETLQQRIDRTGPLATADVVHIGRQIALALAAAHAQELIHRDIKPGNILIEAGPNQHVKITDFGLARAADDASLTQPGIMAGTPMFMAPEQVHGDKLDHRTDLFCLGSVLYTMSSGRPPFRASSTLAVLKRVAEDTPRPISEIIPEVPQWLCDLIARLHAKKPDERFESAQEVADLLTQHLASMQHPGNVKPPQLAAPAAVQTTPPSQETTDATSALRRPRFKVRRWVAVAAGLLTLLGGLYFAEATGVTDVRGTVIRLFSPEGTLEIQIDDLATSVRIDGSELVITGTGAKEIRLKPGRYTVEARKHGKLVRRELVTVTRNGRRVVRVYQEPSKADDLNVTVVPPKNAPDFTNTIGMEFVLLPTGRFWMGGGGGKAGGKDVAIPYDFYLGRYEVTQEEWGKVMKTNPSSFQRTGLERSKVTDVDEKDLKRFPVDNVSWNSCQAFIARLNELERAKEWKYRLPTEAEWEYACRGGPVSDKVKSAFFFYLETPLNTLSPEQANSSESGLRRTCKVGSYPPNRLGLYDMHGNVWEWCDDLWKGGFTQRVHRGGSYRYDSDFSRAAHRGAHPPSYQNNDHGLRLARVPSALSQ
jgi:serine/threonine protein kinase/formylglycine-generating enzyme required for sulfatase activity